MRHTTRIDISKAGRHKIIAIARGHLADGIDLMMQGGSRLAEMIQCPSKLLSTLKNGDLVSSPIDSPAISG